MWGGPGLRSYCSENWKRKRSRSWNWRRMASNSPRWHFVRAAATAAAAVVKFNFQQFALISQLTSTARVRHSFYSLACPKNPPTTTPPPPSQPPCPKLHIQSNRRQKQQQLLPTVSEKIERVRNFLEHRYVDVCVSWSSISAQDIRLAADVRCHDAGRALRISPHYSLRLPSVVRASIPQIRG